LTILFTHPGSSPWGQIDHCDILCPGIFQVSTSSHGGIMVAREVEGTLSSAARMCGERYGGYLCYEEDADEAIVLRELLDKGLWAIPERVKDKARFEEIINNTIRDWNPEYWRSYQLLLQETQRARLVQVQNER